MKVAVAIFSVATVWLLVLALVVWGRVAFALASADEAALSCRQCAVVEDCAINLRRGTIWSSGQLRLRR